MKKSSSEDSIFRQINDGLESLNKQIVDTIRMLKENTINDDLSSLNNRIKDMKHDLEEDTVKDVKGIKSDLEYLDSELKNIQNTFDRIITSIRQFGWLWLILATVIVSNFISRFL